MHSSSRRPIGADPGVVRLRSTNHTRWREWRACALAQRPELHAFTQPGRNAWREPPVSQLCCFPAHGHCFRAVFDGAVNVSGISAPDDYDTLVDLSQSADDSLHRHLALVIDEVSQLLARELGISNVEPSVARFRTYRGGTDRLGERTEGWDTLHADYYQAASYVYTAIIYLHASPPTSSLQTFSGEGGDVSEVGDGAPPDSTPLVGGETGFADALSRDAATGATRLDRGTIVEPTPGRVLLFSGGGENYHAPLPVLRGRRKALQVWFTCACAEPEAPPALPAASHLPLAGRPSAYAGRRDGAVADQGDSPGLVLAPVPAPVPVLASWPVIALLLLVVAWLGMALGSQANGKRRSGQGASQRQAGGACSASGANAQAREHAA